MNWHYNDAISLEIDSDNRFFRKRLCGLFGKFCVADNCLIFGIESSSNQLKPSVWNLLYKWVKNGPCILALKLLLPFGALWPSFLLAAAWHHLNTWALSPIFVFFFIRVSLPFEVMAGRFSSERAFPSFAILIKHHPINLSITAL